MKKIILFVCIIVFTNLGMSQKPSINIEPPISYEVVQTKPVFPGGLSEFMTFVIKNYQVPSEEEEVANGVLEVSIIIDTNGSVSKVDIIKEVGNAGKEVKRVLAKCPKWKPGMQNGVNVSVVYNFPITIK